MEEKANEGLQNITAGSLQPLAPDGLTPPTLETALRPAEETALQAPFDNELLFDAGGHMTDDGLLALTEGRLDELGSLEAAEHLTFCDYCLARYSALMDAMQSRLQSPMRDLIPQVQALMKLRSFRVMTNRYVSAAVAIILAIAMWTFGLFGSYDVTSPDSKLMLTQQPKIGMSISRTVSDAMESMSNGLGELLTGIQQAARDGLAQLADTAKRDDAQKTPTAQNPKNSPASPETQPQNNADGE